MTNSMQKTDDTLDAFLARGLDEAVYPGAVAAVGTADGIGKIAAAGRRDPERDDAMTRTTVFDAASLTKPVITATTALSLVESGVVALSDELHRYLPELEGHRRGEIRLLELLTHSSGLQPYAFSKSWDSPSDVFDGLRDRSLLEAEPGTRYEYSCLNFVYLAEALRRATDRSLADLAETHVFDPVGMNASCLGPTDEANLAATYCHEHRDRTLRGEVHDPLGWAMDGDSGNAGLFTTVDDLAAFARSYLVADGTVLSAATVERLQDDWLPDCADRHSLGWRLADGTYPAPNWSRRGLGHTGYTGTSLWLDHDRDRFAVLLTNQVYDGKDTGLIRFRERFHAMVAAGRFD
ncbi:CubicO group peptidase, beta-lactamase class C family [Haladaptatus litoreus]|uniref:CubicO group peptidase, beta-lactamase class C family n=2 Tax=Haladaptatus litoreus TaxID=553468 RepID=A0A1N7CQJ8_9EURY|nr:CubicO group peptidase, beta-lactamase class C family [Haladaptatus litoreus]